MRNRDRLSNLNEVDEVLERCVQMSLFAERGNLLEMRVIDVCVDAEEALEDVLHDRLEVLGERHTWQDDENEIEDTNSQWSFFCIS